MDDRISVEKIIIESWRLFKERPWFNMGVILSLNIVAFIVNMLGKISSLYVGGYMKSAYSVDMNLILVVTLGVLFSVLILGTVVFMINIFKVQWSINMVKKTEHVIEVSFNKLNNIRYLMGFATALFFQGFFVAISFLLFIIPGFVVLPALVFVPLVFADKYTTVNDAWSAVKYSWNITKGHKKEIWILLLVIFLINMFGMILLMVGLLISVPVSLFAMANMYFKLKAIYENNTNRVNMNA